MNINLGQLAESDTPSLIERLREIIRDVEAAFRRVRVDDALIIGGGTKIAKYVSATKTWDPGSVANGGQTSTTVTVPGAALGNMVLTSFSLDLQLMQLTGEVSSPNTISVVLRNGTGGALDLASGILRASVIQH